MGILTGIALVLTALFFGGWEWALVTAIGVAPGMRRSKRFGPVMAAGAVGLFWLGLFQVTGDRRLFFPYAIQYAAQLPGLLGGATVIALFAAIRTWQDATPRVLVVELAVAAAALGVGAAVHRRLQSRIAASALASLLAFAGLIL